MIFIATIEFYDGRRRRMEFRSPKERREWVDLNPIAECTVVFSEQVDDDDIGEDMPEEWFKVNDEWP